MNRKILWATFAALVAMATFAAAADDDELTVFTAASLTGAFSEIGRIFENETGMAVAFNFDGSQALRTQMRTGLMPTYSPRPTRSR